jgi:hypothetical protein
VIVVEAISRSWTEGDGLDLENYKDLGVQTGFSANSDNQLGLQRAATITLSHFLTNF